MFQSAKRETTSLILLESERGMKIDSEKGRAIKKMGMMRDTKENVD
jgi:hypothetical protein